eukprot:306176_1
MVWRIQVIRFLSFLSRTRNRIFPPKMPVGQQYKMQTLDKFVQAQEYKFLNHRSNNNLIQMNVSFSIDPTSTRHVCTIPLNELDSVPISGLKVGKINHGKQLKGHLITEPYQSVSVMSILQDTEGNALLLALYNYAPQHQTDRQLRKLLPKGSEVIVKEPYCKVGVSQDVMIRIDNPHTNFMLTTAIKKDKNATKSTKLSNGSLKKQKKQTVDKSYIGAIEIKYVSDRIGRGIFATDNILSGTVILNERCVAFGVGGNEGSKKRQLSLAVD